jgi:hypothetical protein
MDGNKIKFSKYGGIVFANSISADSENPVTLDAQKIVATDNEDLLETRIEQIPVRHLKAQKILVRGRK